MLASALVAAAALFIATAGIALMAQRPRMATRLFIAAIVVIAAIPLFADVFLFFSHVSIAPIVRLGIVLLIAAAAIAGRIGSALLIAVVASAAIFLGAATPVWVMMLAAAPLSIFVGIWLLQRLLHPFYGDDASAHVAGVYLVRVFDAAGRALLFLLTAPFRMLGQVRRR